MPKAWYLGIEIGGTKLQLGIGGGDGALVALERFLVDPARGPAGILEQVEAGYPLVLDQARLTSGEVGGIGIGFGGPVDSAAGRIQKSYQVAGWERFPLAAWVRDHLGVADVAVENDCDAAALAEARFGAGAGSSPLLYVTVGSGVGGALIIDGRIYRGFGLGAVEIGHLRVPDTSGADAGPIELEQVASGWGIARAARAVGERLLADGRRDWIVLERAHGRPDRMSAIMVAQAALEGDAASAAILDRARKAMALALSQAITLLAPRRIVMGGGVSLIGDEAWFNPIRQLIDEGVFEQFKGHVQLVPAALGEAVVVHGAVLIAKDKG